MPASVKTKYAVNAGGFVQENSGYESSRVLAPDFVEKSYWWEAMAKDSWKNPTPPKSVDVVIVGAGVTGLNAAIELARGGKSVAIFDAADPGRGGSSRNSGFLGRFLKKSFTELVATYGVDKATAYYSELYEALNVSMKEVVERENIDCDFDVSGRVVLARSQKQLSGMIGEYEIRHQHLGEDIKVLGKDDLQREIKCSDVFCGGVLIPDMASIHPGKYVNGLLETALNLGVQIFGNTRVSGISKSADKFDIETKLGNIAAADVIIATNGYTGKELGWFARRLVPFQGFVIATEEMPLDRAQSLLPSNRNCTDDDFDTMAIRLSPDKKRIITSGRTAQSLPLKEKANLLRNDLLRVFPELTDVGVSFAWSGYCAAPFDTMPKIGKRADGVWYATGFTFMGMPQGTYFGRKVAFQLLGDTRGKTIYSGAAFNAAPLYDGNPWFLPILMKLMRAKNYFGNR